MIEENFKKGIREIQNIRMTEAEKTRMLQKVFEAPLESPFVRRAPSFVLTYLFQSRTLVAASLVLMLSFGGALYASDESLPGDILYPIKTGVVEPVLDVVNRAPEKKLVWEEEKVERRIVEAERLIEKDELDEDKLLELERKIERSSIAFSAAASLVASSSATSSSSRKDKEKKIKQEFKTKINERRIAFDNDDEEVDDAAASATLMMTVEVSSQEGVLNELTNDSSKRQSKNLRSEKIERLKRAATKNLNGDSDDDDDDFINGIKFRGDGSVDDTEGSSTDDDFVDGVKLRGDGSVDDNSNGDSSADDYDRDEDRDDDGDNDLPIINLQF